MDMHVKRLQRCVEADEYPPMTADVAQLLLDCNSLRMEVAALRADYEALDRFRTKVRGLASDITNERFTPTAEDMKSAREQMGLDL